MLLIILTTFALICIISYVTQLDQAIKKAAQLSVSLRQESEPISASRLSVIVPAYNEAENVYDCLASILNSTALTAECLDVWLVDDQSNDATLTIAHSLQQALNDPRLHILVGQPRPEGEVWVGKNWACVQGAEEAQGNYLLFLDADVRLRPGAIESALQMVITEKLDLLSCVPAIVCGCLAEWLVQPLIMSTLSIGFNFEAVNDPTTDVAFATGQFMLFDRAAYDNIGGHRAVCNQVVEDVELARLVKFSGLKLCCLAGNELASVQMYRSWRSLWEGWTKNLYQGSQRNLQGMLLFAGLLLLTCTLPWAIVLFLPLKAFFLPLTVWDWGTIVLSLMMIAIQYYLRQQRVAAIPPRYWWLTGIGGILVTAIAIGSIIKTETGWGWTWRGRSLKQVNS